MLRRVVGVAALAVMLVVGTAAPGIAQEVAPGGGSDSGQHVAGMAPEHAVAHGADFGGASVRWPKAWRAHTTTREGPSRR